MYSILWQIMKYLLIICGVALVAVLVGHWLVFFMIMIS